MYAQEESVPIVVKLDLSFAFEELLSLIGCFKLKDVPPSGIQNGVVICVTLDQSV